MRGSDAIEVLDAKTLKWDGAGPPIPSKWRRRRPRRARARVASAMGPVQRAINPGLFTQCDGAPRRERFRNGRHILPTKSRSAFREGPRPVSRLILRTVEAPLSFPCRRLRRSALPRCKRQSLLSANMRIDRPPRLPGVPRRWLRAGHAPTVQRALLLAEAGDGTGELRSANAQDYARFPPTRGKPS
jgi:hypothetical protein